MKPFIGFTTDKHKTIRVPEGFFEDILPQITSMLEMKVTLYLFWRLSRVANGANGLSPRMVSLGEMSESGDLRSALSFSKGPRSFEEALREGLELCVSRGTLLQLLVREDTGNGHEPVVGERWYILNTKDSRAWVGALAKGEIDVATTPLVGEPHDLFDGHHPIRVIVERPSIYALYEQNIGLLTPILAEQLQDAEKRYPVEWIELAFGEAVSNNKRSWRYIERILERWAAEGKQSGKTRGPDGRSIDPDKYTKGKYAFLFRPE
jgi:DnaD/phage-associated family protein